MGKKQQLPPKSNTTSAKMKVRSRAKQKNVLGYGFFAKAFPSISTTAKRPEKVRGEKRKSQAQQEQPLEMWVLEKPGERLLARRGWTLQSSRGAPAAGK